MTAVTDASFRFLSLHTNPLSLCHRHTHTDTYVQPYTYQTTETFIENSTENSPFVIQSILLLFTDSIQFNYDNKR
jgi:hypothetical protein